MKRRCFNLRHELIGLPTFYHGMEIGFLTCFNLRHELIGLPTLSVHCAAPGTSMFQSPSRVNRPSDKLEAQEVQQEANRFNLRHELIGLPTS